MFWGRWRHKPTKEEPFESFVLGTPDPNDEPFPILGAEDPPFDFDREAAAYKKEEERLVRGSGLVRPEILNVRKDGLGMLSKLARLDAEPDLCAVFIRVPQNHSRDRHTYRRVLLQWHAPIVEELRDRDKLQGHRVTQINEDAKRVMGCDRAANGATDREPALGLLPHRAPSAASPSDPFSTK